jgi:hypothetical protein
MPLPRLLLLALLLAPVTAHAQQSDTQLWLLGSGTVEHGEVAVTLETIARSSDLAGGFYHAEIGGWVTFPIAEGVEAGIGYRHVEEWDDAGALPNEERLRQQLSVQLGSGFSARTRIEQRFLSSGGDVGVRARQQWRYGFRAGRLAPFVAHEDFVNLNATDWGQQRGYESYINQYRFGRDGARDRMDHIASFNLALTL